MVVASAALSLAGAALGTLGGALLFVEFFQLPSYVSYNQDIGNYTIQLSPSDAGEYTWAGRVGALLLALAFALQFVAMLL